MKVHRMAAAAGLVALVAGGAAFADCGAPAGWVCSDVFVDRMSATDGLALVWTSGNEALIASGTCVANDQDKLKLYLAENDAEEIYSLLLTALTANKKVDLWVSADGGGQCKITQALITR